MAGRPPSRRSIEKGVIPRKPHKSNKIELTDLQRVKVQIIDWKRCSVRSLLIVAYISLVHLISYAVIIGLFYHTIFQSVWLKAAYVGFIADLLLYFFGTCAAVKAITYAWNPVKFILGIVCIFLAMGGTIVLWILASTTTTEYENGLTVKKLNLCADFMADPPRINESDVPDEMKRWGFQPFGEICQEMHTAATAIQIIPYVMPPIALLCVIMAGIAAIMALSVTPRKYKDPNNSAVKIDAAWLEPYETYDFYVGRNIPKIPGYDGAYEGTIVDTAKFLEGSDEDEEIHNVDIRKVAGGAKKVAAVTSKAEDTTATEGDTATTATGGGESKKKKRKKKGGGSRTSHKKKEKRKGGHKR